VIAAFHRACPKKTMHKPILVAASVLLAYAVSQAQETKSPRYPTMAPLEQYRMDRDAEIALARSAAPPSVSADAEVLVFGTRGYEVAIRGKNGFVCFVERSWTAGFDEPEFWNPKGRAPNCFNPPAARSVLPHYLKRAQWVAAGASREQMIEKTRAAIAARELVAPEHGAMTFMMSRYGDVDLEMGGPWLPHIMLFVPRGQAAAWGRASKAHRSSAAKAATSNRPSC
jgi:hypothetical protein